MIHCMEECSWACLPVDLLSAVFKHLSLANPHVARKAYTSVRLTCSVWRDAVDNVINVMNITSLPPSMSSCSLARRWPRVQRISYSHQPPLTSEDSAMGPNTSSADSVIAWAATLPHLLSLSVLGASHHPLTITNLHSEMALLRTLTHLCISKTDICEAPETLSCITSLNSLDVSCNLRLNHLPTSIACLTSLRFLNVSWCRLSIQHICSCIASLSSLEHLNISGSCPPTDRILPAAVFSLPKLTTLSLDACYVSSLPSGPFQCNRLTSLSATCNNLRSLPLTFTQLTSLRSLALSYNSFVQVPPAALMLTSLTSLDLSCNIITSLPTGLANAQALRTLNLSHNQLRYTSTSAIAVPELLLDGNPISYAV